MNEPLTIQATDVVLLPFLQATDHEHAERLLAELIREQADPIITKILKTKLRVSLNGSQGNQQNQDALEMANDLRAKLIADLRAVQQNPGRKSITSFRDYVAVKTYSACADYFREKNPRRWRLKNLLRYQLKQNPRFALWKAENSYWYAGLSEWREAAALSNHLPSSQTILEMYSTKPAQDISAAELLSAVFESSGQPIEFERIVTLAAEVWSVTDLAPESMDITDREPVPESPGVDLLLEQRLYLAHLWLEVCRLPVLQRTALLLNLRDAQGGSAIFFIPHLGIASQKQIAKMLELNEEEFQSLWGELPLDDACIAEMFGITRQQVINLRKTARERLARRMEKSEVAGGTNSKKGPWFTA